MITTIQDVYYNVADMERAIRFYRDILGLTVLSTNPHWTALAVGDARLGLHWTENGAPVPPIPRDSHGAHAGATVTFKTDDIDKTYADLVNAGVKFLSPVTRNPWGALAVFEDPDGNVLKLMQAP